MSHASEFDEYGHKDHGHVIVSLFTLRFVLIALLACTLLTSGAAWAESTIASTFHVIIPQWINACVALSIAALKTALVVGFFMQLKYDNPMNTVIFVFTILTVFSFLGFTSLDIGNRGTIERFKSVYAYPGGNLAAGPGAFVDQPVDGQSIVARAQNAPKKPEEGQEHAEPAEHEAIETLSITEMGYLPDPPKHGGSTPNTSRPTSGVTIPSLPGYHVPKPPHAETPAAPAQKPAPAGEQKGEKPVESKPAQNPKVE